MIYIKKWLEYYDKIFTIEDKQISFLNKLCNEFSTQAKFLSVEAGTAKASIQLDKMGHDVTVTDSFIEFTNAVNEQLKKDTEPHNLKVCNLHPMDIVRYLGKDVYNVIYCANYRLIFMKDKATIQKLMFDSKRLLCDGGYLVLDLINFAKYDFGQPRIDFPPRKSEDAQLYSYILKDSNTMKYYLNQQIVTNDGKIIDEVKQEEITPISQETFKKFTSEVGFSSIEFYNDYEGTPLQPDSEKIICVLRK